MSLDLTELRNKVSEIKVNPRWNLWASGERINDALLQISVHIVFFFGFLVCLKCDVLVNLCFVFTRTFHGQEKCCGEFLWESSRNSQRYESSLSYKRHADTANSDTETSMEASRGHVSLLPLLLLLMLGAFLQLIIFCICSGGEETKHGELI